MALRFFLLSIELRIPEKIYRCHGPSGTLNLPESVGPHCQSPLVYRIRSSLFDQLNCATRYFKRYPETNSVSLKSVYDLQDPSFFTRVLRQFLDRFCLREG